MARLAKMIEKLHVEWQAMPVENRNEILANIRTAHGAMFRVIKLLPTSMTETLLNVAKAAAQASIMPFGDGIEGVIVEVAGAIPELSPYVRQLMGD